MTAPMLLIPPRAQTPLGAPLQFPDGSPSTAPPTAAPQVRQPVAPKPIELTLAEQANEAITNGADPHAVSDRLGQMLQHLKANPDVAAHGTSALAQGADPGAVGSRMWELTQAARAAQSTPFGTSHGSSGTWKDSDLADTSPLGNVSREFLQGATLGAGHKLTAGIEAARDAAAGAPIGDAYNERLRAERAASSEFSDAHPIVSGATEMAGGVAGMLGGGALARAGGEALVTAAPRTARLLTAIGGGTSTAGALGGATRTGRLVRAVGTGSVLGGTQGAIESDGGTADRLEAAKTGAERGAIASAVLAPVASAGGMLVKKLRIPDRIAAAAQSEADAGILSGPNAAIARLIGPKGRAASEIAARAGMDQRGGLVPGPLPSTIPPLAIDKAGPNVESLAKGILRRPGEGQAVLRGALDARQEQMRPAITAAFDRGTGTTKEQGEDLLRRLADEQAARENTASVAKSVNQDAAAAKPAQPNHLEAWQAETGATDNGVAELQRHLDERSAEARQLYGEARKATAGTPMTSKTLDEIRATPVGQQAFAWAREQTLNRGGKLPTVPGAETPPPGFSADEWATVKARAKERGIDLPGAAGPEQEAVDPETLHYAKQYLAKLSRLGIHDGQGGTIATQARGALSQWTKIGDELPDVWRKADQAYAAKSRIIDMLNKGRDIMRTQVNPAGAKAAYNSLDAVENTLATAAPIEQQAFRTGASSAITDKLRNGGLSGKQVAALSDPSSAMSRRIALASGDADLPQRLADRLAPVPHQIPAAPPIPEASAESQAAARGLDVLKHGVSAPGAAPAKSLAQLDATKAGLPASERKALQRGAAQAVRGEWQGAGSAVQSPGRIFNASPERAQQVAHAFPDQAGADAFQQRVAGWDATQAQRARLLGGSDTKGNFAEDAARNDQAQESALGHAIRGNFGAAFHTMRSASTKEQQDIARRMSDREIAHILTSPDVDAIPKAVTTALRREGAKRKMSQAIVGGAVGAVDPDRGKRP